MLITILATLILFICYLFITGALNEPLKPEDTIDQPVVDPTPPEPEPPKPATPAELYSQINFLETVDRNSAFPSENSGLLTELT